MELRDRYFWSMVQNAGREVRSVQKMFDLELFIRGRMDEASLLFETEGELDEFLQWAKAQPDLEHFNSVRRDGMIRQDQEEAFVVRFEFLRPFGANWRIEAMHIVEGIAPLHKDILQLRGSGCVVHVSYKCEDYASYYQNKKVLGNSDVAPALREEAEYVNSYGKFSYWSSQVGPMPYIKPRVNLRDAAK